MNKERNEDDFIEEYTGLGSDVDKVLEAELENGDEKTYDDVLNDKEKQIYENRIKQLHLQDKYERMVDDKVRNGKKVDPHHLHEYGAAFIGASLVTLGFLYQETFFGLYIVGLILTFSKSLEIGNIKGDTRLVKLIRNHPLWYILGGMIFIILFIGAGYTIPNGFEVSLTGIVVHGILGI